MRSEESILAGVLELQIGGAEKSLRVLRIAELREWKKGLGAIVAEISDIEIPTSAEGISKMAGMIADLPGDRITTLVLAYDVDHELGTLEAFEKEASADDAYRAFRAILEASFPFVEGISGAMTQIQALFKAAQSAPVNSMSSPLQNGASTRKRLKVALPSSS